jgi:hypothetical protein
MSCTCVEGGNSRSVLGSHGALRSRSTRVLGWHLTWKTMISHNASSYLLYSYPQKRGHRKGLALIIWSAIPMALLSHQIKSRQEAERVGNNNGSKVFDRKSAVFSTVVGTGPWTWTWTWTSGLRAPRHLAPSCSARRDDPMGRAIRLWSERLLRFVR